MDRWARNNVGKGGAPTPFVNSFDQPAVGSLRYNTSQQGQPLPIVYGTQRVSINVLELWDFQGSSGKGGKGGGSATSGKGKKSAAYSVFTALGIAQGPWASGSFYNAALGLIVTPFTGSHYGAGAPAGSPENNRVWANDGITYSNSVSGVNLYSGADGQAPDSTFVTQDPNKPVLGYSGTTYVTGDPLQLGQAPTLPNVSFEITGACVGTIGSDFSSDANPAQIVIDLLTNSRYGAGYPASNLDSTGTITDFGTYCQAAGLAMSLLLDRCQPAARWIEEICTLTVAAPFYTAGLLKIVPYSITGFSAFGATWTPNLTAQYSIGDRDLIDWGGRSDPIIVTRSDPSQATNWFGQEYYDTSNSYNPNISYQFDQGAIDLYGLRSEPVSEAHSFTNLTSANASTQLQLQRKQLIRNTFKFQLGWTFALLDPMDIVELTDVNVGLNATPVRIRSIEENDNLELTVIAEELPGLTSVAPAYAMTVPGSQTPNVQNLPGNANAPIIFEPNSPLSSNQYQAWIISSGGAEELATGAATSSGAVLTFTNVTSNVSPLPAPVAVGWTVEDLSASGVISPGTVINSIVVNTLTTLVTLSANVTGAGVANGDTIGFFDANWGGANVWVSYDGSSYTMVGTIYAGARQGKTTGLISAYSGSNPDNTNTLSVDLTESLETLSSGSSADAAGFITLCYCDGELLSYETATLTATYNYNLTTLYRGLFGTTAGTHVSGSNFTYIGLQTDPVGVFKYNYTASLVGSTIYVKLQSFNAFLGQTQELSTLSATAYTLTGAGIVSPINVPFSTTSIVAGSPFLNYTFGAADNFPLNLTGSVAYASYSGGSWAGVIVDIAKNGTNFATLTYAASSTTGTFSGTAESFAPGDVITMKPRTTVSSVDLTGNLAGTS